MAFETSQIRDGTQIAAANYSNGASLSGNGGSGQYLVMRQSAAADHTVILASAIGQQALGILQNKPASGAVADVCIAGVSKAVAGGTITRGDLLMCDASGRVITWTSGSGYAQIGIARESAVVGQVTDINVNIASPKVLT